MSQHLRTKYVLPTGQEVVSMNTFYTCPNNMSRVTVNGADYFMKKQYTEHFIDTESEQEITQSVIMLTEFQLLQETM